MLLLLLLLAVVSANEQSKWNRAVEHVLSFVMLGPLHDSLGPSYFANRTRVTAIDIQARLFRAQVFAAMWSATDTEVQVWPHHRPLEREAIDAVVQDLTSHGFEAQWINNEFLQISDLPEIK